MQDFGSDYFRFTTSNSGLVAVLLAAVLYQANPDKKHGLWNIA
jgi:hypothetical protein